MPKPIIPSEYPRIELDYENGLRFGHQRIEVHPVIRDNTAFVEIIVTDVSKKRHGSGMQRTHITPIVMTKAQFDMLMKQGKRVLKEAGLDLSDGSD